MAWFGRRRNEEPVEDEALEADERQLPDVGDTLDPGASLRPIVDPVGEAEQARISAALESLAAEDVDVDDLTSLGRGLDRAYAGWRDAPEDSRPDHAAIVERYAL